MTVSCLATVIHQPISPLLYCILTIYITEEDFIIDCDPLYVSMDSALCSKICFVLV